MATPKKADKYELLRKALRADGLEVDALEEDSSYLGAVLGFANTLLDIRSFCQE
jgi:hypothetical protein